MTTIKKWLNSRVGRLAQHDATLAAVAGFTAWEASGSSLTWAAATVAGTVALRSFMRLILPVPAKTKKVAAGAPLIWTANTNDVDLVYVSHGRDFDKTTTFASPVVLGSTPPPYPARETTGVAHARAAGHRGRHPVKAPADRFAIKYLHEYLKQPLPAPVYPIDVTHGITAWGMLGNGPDPTCTTHPDGVGDCTFAGRQHNRMAKAAAAGLTESWETSNALVAEYLTYDHGKDQGANIADLLLAWYKAGTIAGFAPVDHTQPVGVDAAMQAFNGVYSGVNLTDNADQLFEEGRPWTVSASSQPDPDDGHCIVKVKADGTKYDGWVTWGADQESTLAWTKACMDEGWVILTEEDAHLVDLPALQADINALGGTGGAPVSPPQPAPVVTPPVTPPPTPIVADALDLTFAPELEAHLLLSGISTKFKEQADAWLEGKGIT